MDLLKREHAPISEAAWRLIDDTAGRVLRTHLTARRLVDVSGPHGLGHAAVATGRLTVGEAVEGVGYGVHQVLPMVEVRSRFSLGIWELDGVLRGVRDPELGPLLAAAHKAALFEERAVFEGFAPGSIRGLLEVAERPSEPVALEAGPLLDAVARSVLDLQHRGVQGPYAMVVGARLFRFLGSLQEGYPLLRQVERLLGGPVHQSELLETGLVASLRGGDAELVLGGDLAVGYEHHTPRELHLFIGESFTFRVLDATAFVALRPGP